MAISPRGVLLVLALGCSLLGGAVHRASAADPTSPPVTTLPRPDLSSWAFMLGRWSCTYTGMAGAGSSFTQNSELIDGGAWLHTRSEIPLLAGPNATNGTLTVDAYTTQDPRLRTWFYTEIDSIGGHTIGTSTGWRDNSFAWSLRDPMSGRVLFTTTITKVGDGEFTSATDVAVAGRRRPGLASTCRKG